MKEISTEIEIEATPDRVWQVVSDFDAYPDWNPFTRDIGGKAERGSKLKVRIESPGGRGMTFKPTVLAADPQRELRWLGRLLIPLPHRDGRRRAGALWSVRALPRRARVPLRQEPREVGARFRRDERGAQASR